MCGIAGALAIDASGSWQGERISAALARMTEAIAHRGPDDAGSWVHEDGMVALAHRRLAIVDLSPRGHQPMSFAKRFVIVFNGEIYNYRELRQELRQRGHEFASDTDTEVIMAAVQEWGIEKSLGRFVGMFAFALWDEHEHVLYLARDRLGEKPLFLRVVDGWLAFGSELRSVEAFGNSALDISEAAVSGYLLNGYVPGPASMWRDVYKLPPGCVLTVRPSTSIGLQPNYPTHELTTSGAIANRRYWRVANRQASVSAATTENRDALDELDGLVAAAVDMQLQCDVPVGVFLSGGIDSTVVAALAQSRSNAAISTFTVKFSAPGFDESVHAAAVAGHLKTRHTEIELDPEQLMREIPTLAAAMDEPTANASYFPLYAMSREARKQVKVILTGDGGDELFGGYNRYRLTPSLWKRISWLPHSLRSGLARSLDPSGVRTMTQGLARLRFGVSGQVSPAVATKKLARALRARTLGESYTAIMRCWYSSAEISTATESAGAEFDCSHEGFLDAAARYDLRSYLPDDNLAKADRATMAAGIEGRIPLLDHRIVEFAFALPDEFKIRDGQSKWLLRQLAYRYVPATLLDRPKMGFTVPVREWLRGPLRSWAADLLQSQLPYDLGLLKRKEVTRAWDALQRHDAPIAWELWSIVIYSAWLHGRVRSSTGQARG